MIDNDSDNDSDKKELKLRVTQVDYENEFFMMKFFETANITFERTYNTWYPC